MILKRVPNSLFIAAGTVYWPELVPVEPNTAGFPRASSMVAMPARLRMPTSPVSPRLSDPSTPKRRVSNRRLSSGCSSCAVGTLSYISAMTVPSRGARLAR